MIQAVPFQRVRVPVLAVGALGVVALAAVSAPRINSSAPPALAPTIAEFSASVPQRPSLAATTDCRATAYVTGDMAGDASPSAIYAQLCPGR